MPPSVQAEAVECVFFRNAPYPILHELNGSKPSRRTRVVLVIGPDEIPYVAHLPSDATGSCECLQRSWDVVHRLRHHGFARLFGLLDDKPDGTFPGFLREFLPEHDTLWRRLFPKLDVATFLRHSSSLAFALHRLHVHGGVLHDVTPANICWRKTPWDGRQVAFTDFDTATPAGEHCHEGSAVGTPAYMSREQVYGRPAGGHMDQCGLAITLLGIATLTEGLSLPDEDTGSTIRRAAEIGFPYWEVAESALPERVCTILERASLLLPERRYANCYEFGRALRNCLATLSEEERLRPLPEQSRSAPELVETVLTLDAPFRPEPPERSPTSSYQ